MKPSTLLAAALLTAAAGVQAADPVASNLTPGYSFVEYAGSATVGIGAVDTDSTLFFIDEKSAFGFKSWFIFFDPKKSQSVSATITFDAPIDTVFMRRIGLEASQSTYGAAGVGYDYRILSGLENNDSISVSGNVLTINWKTSDPGDHIRVLTAVPEPATTALFAAGLAAVGFTARRRRSR